MQLALTFLHVYIDIDVIRVHSHELTGQKIMQFSTASWFCSQNRKILLKSKNQMVNIEWRKEYRNGIFYTVLAPSPSGIIPADTHDSNVMQCWYDNLRSKCWLWTGTKKYDRLQLSPSLSMFSMLTISLPNSSMWV